MRKDFTVIRVGAVLVGVSFIFLLLTGCDKLNFGGPKKPVKPPSAYEIPVKGTIIAKVNNIPITLEDLNEEIEAFNRQVPADRSDAKITTRQQKISYLKEAMIPNLIIYNEALNRGLDRKEDVLIKVEKGRRVFLAAELERELTQNEKVDSKEIEQAYNAYTEQYKELEERSIREIVVSSEQQANEILIELLRGADFATLALEKSKAPSAKKGGDLGYIRKGTKFPDFDSVAFAAGLGVGKYSNVFKGPDGYYILKLEGKKGGEMPSKKEVWEQLEQTLLFLKRKQKIDELVSKLSADPKFRIETFEGSIKD